MPRSPSRGPSRSSSASIRCCLSTRAPLRARRAWPSGGSTGDPSVLRPDVSRADPSRMRVGHGDVTPTLSRGRIVLFEPDRDDAQMFFANFSATRAANVCPSTASHTRHGLRARRRALPPLGLHGVHLHLPRLTDARAATCDAPTDPRPLHGTRPAGRAERRRETFAQTLLHLERWLAASWAPGLHPRRRGRPRSGAKLPAMAESKRPRGRAKRILETGLAQFNCSARRRSRRRPSPTR